MKGGLLEVLLVSAEDLKDAHLLGLSRHYVVLKCGEQTFASKITAGKDRKVWWNEKFTFKLSSSEWKDMTKLNLRIMEKDKFHKDSSVGQATVHLRGIVREGIQKGCIELMPAPYNVVLEDGTYKGELKIGLKFISNVEVELQAERRECNISEKQPQSLYRTILNLCLKWIKWPRFFIFRKDKGHAERRKHK